MSNGGFDFGWALWKLRWAQKVKRSGWPKDRWVALQKVDALSKMQTDYLFCKNPQGSLVPWSPPQEDLLAEDWVIAE